MVFESVQQLGVRTVPLNTFIAQSSTGQKPYPGKIILARHEDYAAKGGDAGSVAAKRMADFAVDRFGDPFAPGEIVKIGMRICMGRLNGKMPKSLGSRTTRSSARNMSPNASRRWGFPYFLGRPRLHRAGGLRPGPRQFGRSPSSRPAERRRRLTDRAGDGGGHAVHPVGGVVGEDGHRGDDHQKDQPADQAVFDCRGSALIGPEATKIERPQMKSRSQATSGASAGGIG